MSYRGIGKSTTGDGLVVNPQPNGVVYTDTQNLFSTTPGTDNEVLVSHTNGPPTFDNVPAGGLSGVVSLENGGTAEDNRSVVGFFAGPPTTAGPASFRALEDGDFDTDLCNYIGEQMTPPWNLTQTKPRQPPRMQKHLKQMPTILLQTRPTRLQKLQILLLKPLEVPRLLVLRLVQLRRRQGLRLQLQRLPVGRQSLLPLKLALQPLKLGMLLLLLHKRNPITIRLLQHKMQIPSILDPLLVRRQHLLLGPSPMQIFHPSIYQAASTMCWVWVMAV